MLGGGDELGKQTQASFQSLWKSLVCSALCVTICEKPPDKVKSSHNLLQYYFDLVSGEYEIRLGQPDFTGKLCVIGANLDEDAINKLFLKD